ncbi:MAG: UDP-N-acetylmuramoylalanyl-D-glutamate--L-lysine ligase [uncultured Nocardioidaceae bacterium]|uniref:UDP-N-acetylmuramoyl-L-alanyl-D-glutamate--2,6-diaminopimelate ligase n=1 Tax=uncultured Nocardioidaceae bacterium TaxID=253824 RepID=A0A6J4KYT7_9ACTN|nr:MAG: UDP-N-acetylmuramoylalanyl-D-glutamate--L-lysine ligase [uncultured Nocardioidaceae bacterium]
MPGPTESLDDRPLSVDPLPLRRLEQLLGVSCQPAAPDITVSGVALGSARVRPGDLYAALPGARTHGARFTSDAVAAGAVAVLTDPTGSPAATGAGVPVLVIEQPRYRLGEVARAVYGDPSAALLTLGVTGTQGKTTTTAMMGSALRSAGRHAGVVGTLGTCVDGRPVRSALTTPEAPDLQALFAVMREQGVDACAMEVSSHALVQRRVDGVLFDVAVFLNLGRDHLDFHADLEDYFAAKADLFTAARARRAVVDIDDEHGRRLASSTELPVTTVAVDRPADWRAVDVRTEPTGSTFTLVGPDGRRPAAVPLPGAFNVRNALAATVALVLGGLDVDAAVAGIAAAPEVPGRMQRVELPRGDSPDVALPSVVVDYAHKPDALVAVLEALRTTTGGRLWVVLGAGGDRDRGKRPLMGEVSAARADVVVVTDDNPRTEDPAAIRAAVLRGASAGPAEVREVADRGDAVRTAILEAAPGDCVVVAGKGHEGGQEVGGVVHPFDDREVAAQALAERRARAKGLAEGRRR